MGRTRRMSQRGWPPWQARRRALQLHGDRLPRRGLVPELLEHLRDRGDVGPRPGAREKGRPRAHRVLRLQPRSSFLAALQAVSVFSATMATLNPHSKVRIRPGQGMRGLPFIRRRLTPQRQEPTWVDPSSFQNLTSWIRRSAPPCLDPLSGAPWATVQMSERRKITSTPSVEGLRYGGGSFCALAHLASDVDPSDPRPPHYETRAQGLNNTDIRVCIIYIYIYICIYIYMYMYIYIYIQNSDRGCRWQGPRRRGPIGS